MTSWDVQFVYPGKKVDNISWKILNLIQLPIRQESNSVPLISQISTFICLGWGHSSHYSLVPACGRWYCL